MAALLVDFAITEHYAVFMHMPLVFDPKAMIEVSH
jgi:carotenoid cleavage dioxygenase-like enzyme